MLEVSVTAFRNHVPDYLEKIRQGEDIALTSRGRIVARLIPPGGHGNVVGLHDETAISASLTPSLSHFAGEGANESLREIKINDEREYAKHQLAVLRKSARIGDVTTPVAAEWDADRADS